MIAWISPDGTARSMPFQIGLSPIEAVSSWISNIVLIHRPFEAYSQQLLCLNRELHRQLLQHVPLQKPLTIRLTASSSLSPRCRPIEQLIFAIFDVVASCSIFAERFGFLCKAPCARRTPRHQQTIALRKVARPDADGSTFTSPR